MNATQQHADLDVMSRPTNVPYLSEDATLVQEIIAFTNGMSLHVRNLSKRCYEVLATVYQLCVKQNIPVTPPLVEFLDRLHSTITSFHKLVVKKGGLRQLVNISPKRSVCTRYHEEFDLAFKLFMCETQSIQTSLLQRMNNELERKKIDAAFQRQIAAKTEDLKEERKRLDAEKESYAKGRAEQQKAFGSDQDKWRAYTQSVDLADEEKKDRQVILEQQVQEEEEWRARKEAVEAADKARKEKEAQDRLLAEEKRNKDKDENDRIEKEAWMEKRRKEKEEKYKKVQEELYARQRDLEDQERHHKENLEQHKKEKEKMEKTQAKQKEENRRSRLQAEERIREQEAEMRRRQQEHELSESISGLHVSQSRHSVSSPSDSARSTRNSGSSTNPFRQPEFLQAQSDNNHLSVHNYSYRQVGNSHEFFPAEPPYSRPPPPYTDDYNCGNVYNSGISGSFNEVHYVRANSRLRH